MTQTASLESIQEKEMTVVIRPEFKSICQKNACRAAVFNHVLYWIAYKRKQGEAYWYATGQQVYKQLCESWGISIIRREINALIATGLIGETHNPKWGADRTKFFFFDQDQAKAFFATCTQEKICPWCISHLPPVVSDLLTTHLLILSKANDECVKCICQKHQMELLDVANESDRSNKAITKGTTKGSPKKEDSLVVSADAESDGGPSAFLEKIISFEETLEEIRAHADGKALLDPPSYRREEKEPEGLPRVVALLTPTTPESTQKDTVSLSTDGRMMRTPTQMSTQPPTEEEPTQNTLIPAPPIPSLSTKGAAKTPSPDKTDGVEKNKKRATMKDCSPEEQARRRTWQAYFNTRRGGELLHGKGERIDESNCIADLCQDFSDGQINLIDRFVLAEIFPYKLPINRHKAGAHVIWKESQNAREVLKDRQKWPLRDAPPGQALPQAVPSQQEDVYTRKIRELAAESAARYTTPHMQGVAL